MVVIVAMARATPMLMFLETRISPSADEFGRTLGSIIKISPIANGTSVITDRGSSIKRSPPTPVRI